MRTEQMIASWNLLGMEDHDGGGGGLLLRSTSPAMIKDDWGLVVRRGR